MNDMAARPAPIPFIDLQAQRRRLGARIDQAIARVLAHGAFVMGPEVQELEQRLADYAGVRHVVTCASGTDALMMPLMAWGIGPGDAVFCPALTFAATAEAAVLVGATPVFVDVEEASFNIDADSLAAAIEAVAREGRLRPRVVIPVDLFGQPARYEKVEPIARRHGLLVLADAAQSFGASLGARRAGALGHATAASFFPAKPLGCYGDGGAILTDDSDLDAVLRSVRIHGQGVDKYENVRIGINGRLDTIQAAILIEKLAVLDEETAARQVVAARYAAGLGDLVPVPQIAPDARSVWAQYTIRVRDRDRFMAALKAEGIPTAIYYPRPLNRQPAYAHYPVAPGGVPVSERLANEVVSPPFHPYLDPATQDRIIAAARRALVAQA